MFTDLLDQMNRRIDGAEAAVIIGLDGMIVERAGSIIRDDLELIAAEYASLLCSNVRTAADTGLGDLRELVVAAEQSTLMIKILSPEYFLLLVMAPDGNPGRARFEMRKAQLILEHEFVM